MTHRPAARARVYSFFILFVSAADQHGCRGDYHRAGKDSYHNPVSGAEGCLAVFRGGRLWGRACRLRVRSGRFCVCSGRSSCPGGALLFFICGVGAALSAGPCVGPVVRLTLPLLATLWPTLVGCTALGYWSSCDGVLPVFFQGLGAVGIGPAAVGPAEEGEVMGVVGIGMPLAVRAPYNVQESRLYPFLEESLSALPLGLTPFGLGVPVLDLAVYFCFGPATFGLALVDAVRVVLRQCRKQAGVWPLAFGCRRRMARPSSYVVAPGSGGFSPCPSWCFVPNGVHNGVSASGRDVQQRSGSVSLVHPVASDAAASAVVMPCRRCGYDLKTGHVPAF